MINTYNSIINKLEYYYNKFKFIDVELGRKDSIFFTTS